MIRPKNKHKAHINVSTLVISKKKKKKEKKKKERKTGLITLKPSKISKTQVVFSCCKWCTFPFTLRIYKSTKLALSTGKF